MKVQNWLKTKVSDLSIEELKDIIREVLNEYLDEREFRPEFAEELLKRAQSNDLVKFEFSLTQ